MKLLSDVDGLTIFAKGHVDIAEFCAAVEAQFGYDEVPAHEVQHIWMHYGPHGDMRDCGYDYYQHLHDEGGRGRFKVTYWETGL